MIEEWVPNATTAECADADAAPHNQQLWDQNVVPFLPMTLKGWLWVRAVVRCVRMRGRPRG